MGKNIGKITCYLFFVFSFFVFGLSAEAQVTPPGPILPESVRRHLLVQELTSQAVADVDAGKFPQFTHDESGDEDGEIFLDRIWNIGKKLWAVVEAGKPVVNVNFDFASALPFGVKSAAQLDNWKIPQSKAFRVVARNGFGATTVDFTYRIVYIPGGEFSGKGKYLSRIAIYPQSVWVAWGYTFNAQAQVPESGIINLGSSADPLAGAQVDVNWKIDTVLVSSQGTGNYFVQGDGGFKNLTPEKFYTLKFKKPVMDASKIAPFSR